MPLHGHNVFDGVTSRAKCEWAAETGLPSCMSRNALLYHPSHHTEFHGDMTGNVARDGLQIIPGASTSGSDCRKTPTNHRTRVVA